MRRMLSAAAVLAAGLIAPSTADAAIPQVFTKTATPINCTVQASGQRFCGTGTAQIPSWDGMPLDVAVAFPPAPARPDGPYPVIGIYHGWGGTKLSLTGADAQRALTRGYAVFTMTDRGWGALLRRARCAPTRAARGKGYIRLMHNAYEVRDAQYALGQLADDGVIDPQRIGATGGSYGGGMSIALGALRNRIQLPDGTLVAVDEPARQADERSPPPCPSSPGATSPTALTPERQLARLRRRRAVPRRRPPRRHPEAELEQLALPRRRSCSGYYAPLGHRSRPPTSSAGRR